MNRDFALYLLTQNRDLLKQIIHYNGLDEPLKLPEALTGTPICEKLQQNTRFIRKLSEAKPGYFDFENIANRLCFFSKEKLSLLAKKLSACICSNVLHEEIRRDRVMAYRSFLGDELYEFGFRRGSLLVPEFLKSKIVSLYPSAETALYESGKSALQTMINGASKDMAARIVFEDNAAELKLEDADTRVLIKCIVKVLCREIDPSCQNIFK